MELDGALGEIQFTGDFFVGQAAKNTIEDFLFAAGQLHIRLNALPGLQELLSFLGKLAEIFRSGGNHDEVITGGLTADHAMHGKKASSMINGKRSVRAGIDMKMGGPGGFFVEKIHACSR